MKKVSIRKTGIMFIIVAVICGLVAVVLSFWAINSMTRKVPMLIASEKIIAGDPLKAESFKVINIPLSGRPQDAILPGDKIEGLVALRDMTEKDILRRSNVVDLEKENLPVLSTRLRAVNESLENTEDLESSDLRAGEIPIDSIVGMLDGMKEGDKIAVTSVYIDEFERENEVVKVRRTETIFDYIHVLGLKPPMDNFKGSVVIALTQKQFEALALAREKGEFYIALMPYGSRRPEEHPDILSSLYIKMLDDSEELSEKSKSEEANSNISVDENSQ